MFANCANAISSTLPPTPTPTQNLSNKLYMSIIQKTKTLLTSWSSRFGQDLYYATVFPNGEKEDREETGGLQDSVDIKTASAQTPYCRLSHRRHIAASVTDAILPPLPHCRLGYGRHIAAWVTDGILPHGSWTPYCRMGHRRHIAASVTDATLPPRSQTPHCRLGHRRHIAASVTDAILPPQSRTPYCRFSHRHHIG